MACHEGDIRACKLAFAFRRAAVLEKQQGPDYLALFDALNEVAPNSKDVQDFLSMFARLDDSCAWECCSRAMGFVSISLSAPFVSSPK